MKAIRIHESDNVAVALMPLKKAESVSVESDTVLLAEDILPGHKFALREIATNAKIIKYGQPIGHAKQMILPGQWVHTHNTATNLSEKAGYQYELSLPDLPAVEPKTFMGYLREDGSAGIRNELWIIPTVGCVNDVAQRLAQENAHLLKNSGIDGIYAFPHPYGCSQMGDDHASTRKLLANLVRHPNAGAVLVVGLGCENNTVEGFKQEIGAFPQGRIQFLVCQEVEDELAAGAKMLEELAAYASKARRQPLPVSKLVVGMKCGGSDGLSGITANPVVGKFSDLLISCGGSTILTEVPEMFGAEQLLMNRAVSREVFDKTVSMIEEFKQYFTSNGQVVYENPSPGNKQGGITTLEDKSLGCVQKGGAAPVVDVLPYAARVQKTGLSLLSGPGNDLVSATALTAAGAHIILFTTGRGTPFGAPAPTLKLSSNSALAHRKSKWIDFDAGPVAEGESIHNAAERLLDLVIKTASGEYQSKSEQLGYRGIAIFKTGVIL